MDLASVYFLLKALHIISMVAWFAGLFYLPRLFVYHVERPEAAPVLEVMEYKLSRYITFPAAVSTWVFGILLLISQPYLLHMGWIHTKLLLVVGLSYYQWTLENHRKRLAAGANVKSGKFFRFYNEIPTLVLIVVVFLAVLKPF